MFAIALLARPLRVHADPPLSAPPPLPSPAPSPAPASALDPETYALMRVYELNKLEGQMRDRHTRPANRPAHRIAAITLTTTGMALVYAAIAASSAAGAEKRERELRAVGLVSSSVALVGGIWGLTLAGLRLAGRYQPEVRAVRDERDQWRRRYRELRRARERAVPSFTPTYHPGPRVFGGQLSLRF